MKNLLLAVSFALCAGLSARDSAQDSELTVYIGMSRADFKAVMQKLEAKEISAHLSILPEPGSKPSPNPDWRWSLSAYKVVLESFYSGERLVRLTYWKDEEFSSSLVSREKNCKKASEITFNIGKDSCKAKRIKEPEQAPK